MILIFGGTTEGKIAAKLCDTTEKKFLYSTKSPESSFSSIYGKQIFGALDVAAMCSIIQSEGIKLIINAAHPFAVNLHNNIFETSHLLKIQVVRFERRYTTRDKRHTWLGSYEEAICELKERKINKLLALTGVNSIPFLKPFWKENDCWFRILDRNESKEIAFKNEFPENKLLFLDSNVADSLLIESISPDAIITKESGSSGYFEEKAIIAERFNIPLFVIKRPILPEFYNSSLLTSNVVTGENTLRRALEKTLPDYFSLKSGISTGTCATAAAVAAVDAFYTKRTICSVNILLPSLETITVDIKSTKILDNCAVCEVIKESGDDPDVTNGCSVIVKVTPTEKEGIIFEAGEGVGIVTLSGLGLNIGDAAINNVPREMIRSNLFKVIEGFKATGVIPKKEYGFIVNISVPEGKEIAKKTFNPKLGILGGISIIGTSGFVKPYSSQAFLGAIEKEISVASHLNIDTIVLNSGALSEKFAKSIFSQTHERGFIQFGNFIGNTLKILNSYSFSKVVLVIMIGKAVKLADGNLDTHSKITVMNHSFIAEIAEKSDCPPKIIAQIYNLKLARDLWKVIPIKFYDVFFNNLAQNCYRYCSDISQNYRICIKIIDELGVVRGKAGD